MQTMSSVVFRRFAEAFHPVRLGAISIGVAVAALTLVASALTPTPTAISAQAEPSQSDQLTFEQQWNALVKAAQNEGELVALAGRNAQRL